MKFFIDTANIDEISKAKKMGIIDGVTTNPSLIAKEKTNTKNIISKICNIIEGPISVEVINENTSEMVKEAKILRKINNNIVIKIPMTLDGLITTKILKSENIKTNVTLVFSPLQALMAAKAGATYVSPFVGRLDDLTYEGMQLISQIVKIYKKYNYKTKIIVASIRNPMHILNSALLGADVATIPFEILKKIIKHPLTDKGLDIFISDWKKLNKNI